MTAVKMLSENEVWLGGVVVANKKPQGTNLINFLRTYSLLLIYLLTYLLTYSFTHLFTYSLTHSLIHLLTHSLTHSLIHFKAVSIIQVMED